MIKARLYSDKQISFKGRNDLLTDVDLLAEREALDLLKSEYPHFGILSEESEPVKGDSEYTWIVDPLDGTRNFASGLPHCATAVALAQEDEAMLGVVYDSLRDELFTVLRGEGAQLNGKPISVSSRSEIDQCLLGFDMGYLDEQGGLALDMVRALWPGVQSIRIMGSAALGLAYVACGRVDIYFHHHLSPWDLAAGLVMVEEAGGALANRQGDPLTFKSPSVIASSPHILKRFLEATDGMAWRK